MKGKGIQVEKALRASRCIMYEGDRHIPAEGKAKFRACMIAVESRDSENQVSWAGSPDSFPHRRTSISI